VSTEPLLVPVLEDPLDHSTACHHPLSLGEDLSLARPDIDESERVGEATLSLGGGSTPPESGGEAR
jgi:hypothetical protein